MKQGRLAEIKEWAHEYCRKYNRGTYPLNCQTESIDTQSTADTLKSQTESEE